MRPYLLLTPGPLTTTDSVKEAMMSDWCTWDEDYNVGIVEQIRKQLVELATSRPDEYTAVLMQGSGTFCVEATLGTAVRPSDKLLVAANGAYGKRMGLIADYYHIDCDVMRFEETEAVDPARIDAYLTAHVVNRHGKVLIVDAMSSFGGVPIDMARLGIDFMISSANKCIQGVPGFGFVIARRSLLEQCGGVARSLSLDLYDQWRTMEYGHGKWRFTSPTHVVRAFMQAMAELRAEGGIEARHARYRENHDTLVEGMRSLGFRTLLPDEVRSPIITSFYYPNAEFDFKDFYTNLKERGFVIYPGKISQADTFRIGNIGDVFPEDFRRLTQAIKDIEGRKAF